MPEAKTMDLFKSKIEQQEEYVESLQSKGQNSFSLVAAEAFVEGMRDSGYRSTATALYEMVDNAEEAEATRVDIAYTKDGRFVSNVAVIDNGHGMKPDMIRASVLWGGTHRWNSRDGLGRYGFGLPSAAVSITRHYEVYSKVQGGEWHRVVIDLEAIAKGALTTEDGVVIAPDPEKAELPKFVQSYLSERVPLDHGTVVFLKSPDRLTSGFKTANAFHRNMMRNLGKVYRGMLRDLEIHVGKPKEGQKVEPVDPLFLMPNARGYEVGNGIKAEEWDPLHFTVENSETGEEGSVRIRFSYLHPKFQRGKEGKEVSKRMKVMKENESALLVSRAGRHLDEISKTKFPKADNITIQNFDRNWVAEIDFDPVLDEEFGVTVNKQQVTLTDRMWQILENKNLPGIIAQLKSRFREDRNKNKSKKDQDRSKPSETLMAETEKFRTKPKNPTDEQKKKAKERVKEDAKKKAVETNRSEEEVFEEIIEETIGKPYKIIFESLKGAPFYRTEPYGSQTRLFINTSHRFYGDVYTQIKDTSARERRIKTGIELLLFVLGTCEVEVTSEERKEFYETERLEWSSRYRNALSLLDNYDSVEDAEAAEEEMVEDK